MNVVIVIAGILLIACCVCVIALVTVQGKATNGLSGAIMGGDAAGFGSKGRDNNAKLVKLTKIMASVFFVLALVMSLLCMAVK